MNERGRQAESLAASFIERNGLRILARNWSCRFGEIDLIAMDGAVLVFIEVRSRSSRSHGGAIESITLAKRRRLVASANQYLAQTRADIACRFDALLIDGNGRIEWLRDAFGAN